MNTKKISHIGVLVHDVNAATKLWTESFGFKKLEGRKIEGHLEKCPDEPEPGQRTSPGLWILAFGRS